MSFGGEGGCQWGIGLHRASVVARVVVRGGREQW